MPVNHVAVGRQPIVDRDGEVIGFELLYRPVHGAPSMPSGEAMTARVVLSALAIGIDQLVGSGAMFCNVDLVTLQGDPPITLPPERTVIEVLESVVIDDDVVASCRMLRAAGYRIALDDFVWPPGAERLLELASIVKLDFQALSREQIEGLVERCEAYDVQLLAEKVETSEDVAYARSLGFDLFQGYAIERPVVVRGRAVAASTLAQLRLAAVLVGDDLDLEDIEELLRPEPGLLAQLLQFASVGSRHGTRGRVRSTREALVLLGSRQVRRWLALNILSTEAGPSPDGLAATLLRARTVEVLALERGVAAPEVAFTAGLLSALDLLLGVELDEVAASMEIDEALKDAAFRRTGALGRLVEEVVAFEAPDGGHGCAADVTSAAAEAFSWSLPYVGSLTAPVVG